MYPTLVGTYRRYLGTGSYVTVPTYRTVPRYRTYLTRYFLFILISFTVLTHRYLPYPTCTVPYLPRYLPTVPYLPYRTIPYPTYLPVPSCFRMEFLPENSTGLMQPLDVAVFKPVKTHWGKLLDTWRRQLRANNRSAAALPKIVSYQGTYRYRVPYRYRT